MKRIILIIGLVISSLSLWAADITGISNAFKAGNASTLTAQMDQEVDMSVPGKSEKCDASQAVGMLNAFFKDHKPTGFTVLHHADKKENGFFVGKLPTGDKEYRVNVTYRADGDKAIIQSVRIE